MSWRAALEACAHNWNRPNHLGDVAKVAREGSSGDTDSPERTDVTLMND
jgi:hypothetical protein